MVQAILGLDKEANAGRLGAADLMATTYVTQIRLTPHVSVSDTPPDTDTYRMRSNTYPVRIANFCDRKINKTIRILPRYALIDMFLFASHGSVDPIHAQRCLLSVPDAVRSQLRVAARFRLRIATRLAGPPPVAGRRFADRECRLQGLRRPSVTAWLPLGTASPPDAKPNIVHPSPPAFVFFPLKSRSVLIFAVFPLRIFC